MVANAKGQVTKDLHVNTHGRTRQISVSAFLPIDWGWVRVTKTRSDEGTVWLRIDQIITKLRGE